MPLQSSALPTELSRDGGKRGKIEVNIGEERSDDKKKR